MDNKKFSYTYSANQQEEIRRIRDKYVVKEESKIEKLRRLDESVTKTAGILALTLGITGTFLLGIGMCCCMVWNMFLAGIAIGIIGIAEICLAYPVYTKTAERQRKKLAPEIIKLTDELLE